MQNSPHGVPTSPGGADLTPSQRQDAFSPNLTQEEEDEFASGDVHHEEVVETQAEAEEEPPVEEVVSSVDQATQGVPAATVGAAFVSGAVEAAVTQPNGRPMASSTPVLPPRTSLTFTDSTGCGDVTEQPALLFEGTRATLEEVVEQSSPGTAAEKRLVVVPRQSARQLARASTGTARPQTTTGFTLSGIETTVTSSSGGGRPVATVTAKSFEVTSGGQRMTEVIISATGMPTGVNVPSFMPQRPATPGDARATTSTTTADAATSPTADEAERCKLEVFCLRLSRFFRLEV